MVCLLSERFARDGLAHLRHLLAHATLRAGAAGTAGAFAGTAMGAATGAAAAVGGGTAAMAGEEFAAEARVRSVERMRPPGPEPVPTEARSRSVSFAIRLAAGEAFSEPAGNAAAGA